MQGLICKHVVLCFWTDEEKSLQNGTESLPWTGQNKLHRLGAHAQKNSEMQIDVNKLQWPVEETKRLLVLWSLAEMQKQLEGVARLLRSVLYSLEIKNK